jgi:hypothetical protein
MMDPVIYMRYTGEQKKRLYIIENNWKRTRWLFIKD